MPYKQRFLIDSEFCAFNTISKSKWRNPTVITAAPAVRVLGSGAVHLVRQQHEAVTRHAPPTWDSEKCYQPLPVKCAIIYWPFTTDAICKTFIYLFTSEYCIGIRENLEPEPNEREFQKGKPPKTVCESSPCLCLIKYMIGCFYRLK